jgi:hypothetical protein
MKLNDLVTTRCGLSASCSPANEPRPPLTASEVTALMKFLELSVTGQYPPSPLKTLLRPCDLCKSSRVFGILWVGSTPIVFRL